MLFSIADLEEAERLLEPMEYTTPEGVQVKTQQARMVAPRRQWIAYKTYLPAAAADTKTGPIVLFLHDAHQSGQVYEPAALALAETGIRSAALTLGGHGFGRWFSLDERPTPQLTLQEYLRQAELVVQALPVPPQQIILVGGGILGSLLAQLCAGRHQVNQQPFAGLALLGGCLPAQAASAWTLITGAPLGRTTCPSLAEVQAWWLTEDVPEEALAVRLMLCEESAALWQDYTALADGNGWQPFQPPTLPAIVIGGALDLLTRARILQTTADAYGVHPTIVVGAPALLSRPPYHQALASLLRQFSQDVGQPTPFVSHQEREA